MARDDEALRDLRKKFVNLRLVQMKGVDLSLFQFDWNTTIAAFFLNADGTIYARFAPREPAAYSTAALRKTMERVLEAHAKPDRDPFKAKRGPAPAWATPDAMPFIAGRMRDMHCIHCHHVWTGLVRSTLTEGRTIPLQIIYKYPSPAALGLAIDPDDGTSVKTVEGAAEKAGLKVGDIVERAEGQPIFSTADLEWVLQHAPDKGELKLDVRRANDSKPLTVPLADGWRRGGRRGLMAVLGPGMRLEPLDAKAREAAGLAGGRLALRVTNVLRQGAAKDAGFRAGDVLVAVDGKSDPLAEDEFTVLIRTRHTLGAKIKIEVLRAGERVEIVYEVK